jgi:hypothetical protein
MCTRTAQPLPNKKLGRSQLITSRFRRVSMPGYPSYTASGGVALFIACPLRNSRIPTNH